LVDVKSLVDSLIGVYQAIVTDTVTVEKKSMIARLAFLRKRLAENGG
jgi:hypothetical protein